MIIDALFLQINSTGVDGTSNGKGHETIKVQIGRDRMHNDPHLRHDELAS